MFFEVPTPSVAVAGSKQRFPVHRIYCVGRNYAEHVREMGNDPAHEPPIFFLKPADAVVASGSQIPYPPKTSDLHHEIELVVALGKGGCDIAADDALDHVFGYAVGIDLTRRDLQIASKKKGQPWDTGKSFEGAAPISAIHRVQSVGHMERGRIWISVNETVRQDSDISEMIYDVADAIAQLSLLFTLAPGDLLYTGTPSGVAALVAGDVVSGGIEGLDDIRITIT
jgi:fumarylpyruvate hydrolase